MSIIIVAIVSFIAGSIPPSCYTRDDEATDRGDMNFTLQLSWYMASAACRSLTADSTRILTLWLSSSFRISQILRVDCLTDGRSPRSAVRQRNAGLHLFGFFESLSTTQGSPQNRQCSLKLNDVIEDRRPRLGACSTSGFSSNRLLIRSILVFDV